MKKAKAKPVRINGAGSFADMIKEAQKKGEEAMKFVQETGLCCGCKKNPVLPKSMHCQECKDKAEEALQQLRGPGFMELKIPVGKGGI